VEKLNCFISSPWVDVSRKVEHKQEGIVVHQKMEIKKSWLAATEQESNEYKNLQLALNKHFNQGIAIVCEQ